MNTEITKVSCPYYSGNGKKNKSIVCRGEHAAYDYIKMEFTNTDERRMYSDNYCKDGVLYENCPLFCALKDEEELTQPINKTSFIGRAK